MKPEPPAAAPDHWTGCSKCGDTHRDSERVWRKSRWSFGVSLCPRCGGWAQKPRNDINLQRELPLERT